MAEDGAGRNAVVPGDRMSILVIAARSVCRHVATSQR
jgi:hypothetical protein